MKLILEFLCNHYQVVFQIKAPKCQSRSFNLSIVEKMKNEEANFENASFCVASS